MAVNSIQGFTIFCDDIRHEISGKTTYVGAYNNSLLAGGGLPAAIPQLCFAVSIRVPQHNPPSELKIRIIKYVDSSSTVLAESIVPFDAELLIDPSDPAYSPDGFYDVKGEFRLAPFIINEECRIGARCYDGDVEYKLGSLKVGVNDGVEVGFTD